MSVSGICVFTTFKRVRNREFFFFNFKDEVFIVLKFIVLFSLKSYLKSYLTLNELK
jgi:hypothetical protein